MSTTYPIKEKEQLEKFKNYFQQVKPNTRNYAMIILGLNTAFRIGDLLSLRWTDVYDIQNQCFRKHICINEQKTGKERIVAINSAVCEALDLLQRNYNYNEHRQFLFPSPRNRNKAISRSQAFRIVKKAAEYAGLEKHVGCHSLRKTFGYQAWKQGVQPAMLMDLYNHSSYSITKHYMCIEQDDRDKVYLEVQL